MDAREFRHTLAAIAHEMNRQVQDWQRLDEHRHLAIATEALDAGDLAAACAAMLCALEVHERTCIAAAETREPAFAVDELRRLMEARRAR
jgi:hypothetical protein